MNYTITFLKYTFIPPHVFTVNDMGRIQWTTVPNAYLLQSIDSKHVYVYSEGDHQEGIPQQPTVKCAACSLELLVDECTKYMVGRIKDINRYSEIVSEDLCEDEYNRRYLSCWQTWLCARRRLLGEGVMLRPLVTPACHRNHKYLF